MKLHTLLLILLSLLLLTEGAVPFPDVIQKIVDQPYEWNPLLHERLPRLLVIFCTGASLAVSGAVMQALFQNPLASPSVLGISLGGSLSVFFVFLFRWHLSNPFCFSIAAFLGCLLTLLLINLLTVGRSRDRNQHLLLTGLAVSTFLIAIQGALVYIYRDQWSLVQSWLEWEAGSTLDRSWLHVHQQLPLTLVGLFVCLWYRQELNLLSLGEEEALNLGVDVERVRFRLFLAVALLTAGSLVACGIIPFFGLVLPHIIRQFDGADHRRLIPHSIIYGALSMIGIDWLLRYLHVQILSIGQVSAFFGGLFFLYLVIKPRGRFAAV